MKKIGLIVLLFLSVGALHATHQKAAEITYEHVSGFTYRFTIVTFTYSLSLADRPWLTIDWGYEGQQSEVARNPPGGVNVGGNTRENRYVTTHTFPGPGTYYISMEDPNRNGGVVNMPNSINTPMYVETKLVISPWFSPPNSSPRLLNPPVDVGCLGVPFMHNPGAFDPDGDSLSFRFVNCRGADGLAVPGYTLPHATNSLEINPVTGDLIWDSPMNVGEFNFAILIEEFRGGMSIGSIVRDMQITIEVCDNRPPELHLPEKICVLVGDTLVVPVLATDPDIDDILTVSATGGIFLLPRNRAVFSGKEEQQPVLDTLLWIPQHTHVQRNPHQVYFRAKDNGTPNLNTLKTLLIQVIGRAPEWDSIVPTFQTISLHWTPILDTNIAAYRIYRAQSRTEMTRDSCDFGLDDPAYELLVELRDRTSSQFLDTAVDQNILYCYRILALYRNGMESQASEEICVIKLSNTPILERVSVSETDSMNGTIELAWRRPLDFDIATDGTNFRYVIHRSLGTTNFSAIDTLQQSDTTYLDERLNTLENYYHYRIELIQHKPDSLESIGFSNMVSSVFANATGRNRRVNVQWQFRHPWRTEGFVVYRKLSSQTDFDSIAFTNQTFFTDTNVVNDSSYTYRIKAFGRHYDERINDYVFINRSQNTEAMPQIDTPCTQRLFLDFTECLPARNGLSWQHEEDCWDDNPLYHIFYRPNKNEPFRELTTQYETVFIHENMMTNIGCYFVMASNRGFVGKPSDTICLDFELCMKYELPNVFTPNDDGFNDVFKALPHEYSGAFTIRIFNRWGNLVFESNDPNFEWDGINQLTKQPSPEGVYFYVAELVIQGLERSYAEPLRGSVTLLR